MDQIEVENTTFRGPPQLTAELFFDLFDFELINENSINDEARGIMNRLVTQCFGNDDEKSEQCQCELIEGKKCTADSDCPHRKLGELCPSTCGDGCSNNPFVQNVWRTRFRLIPRFGAGFGLMTMETISAGDWITPYFGEVVEKKSNPYGPNLRYVTDLKVTNGGREKRRLVVDATKKGGWGRFLNHSHDPNCRLQTICAHGSLHNVLVALKVIGAKTELTYDYGEDFQKMGIKTCFCLSYARCIDFAKAREEVTQNSQARIHLQHTAGTSQPRRRPATKASKCCKASGSKGKKRYPFFPPPPEKDSDLSDEACDKMKKHKSPPGRYTTRSRGQNNDGHPDSGELKLRPGQGIQGIRKCKKKKVPIFQTNEPVEEIIQEHEFPQRHHQQIVQDEEISAPLTTSRTRSKRKRLEMERQHQESRKNRRKSEESSGSDEEAQKFIRREGGIKSPTNTKTKTPTPPPPYADDYDECIVTGDSTESIPVCNLPRSNAGENTHTPPTTCHTRSKRKRLEMERQTKDTKKKSNKCSGSDEGIPKFIRREGGIKSPSSTHKKTQTPPSIEEDTTETKDNAFSLPISIPIRPAAKSKTRIPQTSCPPSGYPTRSNKSKRPEAQDSMCTPVMQNRRVLRSAARPQTSMQRTTSEQRPIPSAPKKKSAICRLPQPQCQQPQACQRQVPQSNSPKVPARRTAPSTARVTRSKQQSKIPCRVQAAAPPPAPPVPKRPRGRPPKNPGFPASAAFLPKHDRPGRPKKPEAEKWCRQCNPPRYFSFGGNLTKHQQRWHKDWKYRCPVCEALFPTAQQLIRHYESHKRKEDRERVQCLGCKGVFVRADFCRKHQKSSKNSCTLEHGMAELAPGELPPLEDDEEEQIVENEEPCIEQEESGSEGDESVSDDEEPSDD